MSAITWVYAVCVEWAVGSTVVISVPESFLSYTRVSAEGNAGTAWAAELPARVDALVSRWGLAIDGPVMHGANGIAIPVLRGTTPCVLKVAWVDSEFHTQVAALRRWSSTPGMVRLLDALPAEGALLLSRLGPATGTRSLPYREALSVGASLLRQLAIPVPVDVSLPTVRSLESDFPDSAPRRNLELGSPFFPYELKQVNDLLSELLRDSSERLLVNYDLHDENILRSLDDSAWVAIDPRVAVGRPEYGVAQLLWWRLDEMPDDIAIREALDLIVSVAGLDRSLARAWTIVRSAGYLLWGLENGLTIDPPRCRRVIQALGGAGPELVRARADRHAPARRDR